MLGQLLKVYKDRASVIQLDFHYLLSAFVKQELEAWLCNNRFYHFLLILNLTR